jgi:hypothetical protein
MNLQSWKNFLFLLLIPVIIINLSCKKEKESDVVEIVDCWNVKWKGHIYIIACTATDPGGYCDTYSVMEFSCNGYSKVLKKFEAFNLKCRRGCLVFAEKANGSLSKSITDP